MRTRLLLLSLLLIHLSASAQTAAYLRCEYLERPLGIDAAQPRLSWRMDDSRQGARQTAYRIQLGTDSAGLAQGKALVWDSGKQASDRQLISYPGKALQPFTRYYWRLQLWDKDGKALPAALSWFETGMRGQHNWQGTWISDRADVNLKPAGYFRKEFSTPRKVRSARAYIAAAGLYELYLNGQRVGDHVLDPMYTRFDRRNLYVTYDVTALLQSGRNALGVLLGNGWYNHQSLAVWNFHRAPWRARPAFCLDLRIIYDDGSTETVSSGGDWKTGTGPLVFNSIYTAEHVDARLEQPGWSRPGFDDSQWNRAGLRAAPSQNIVSQAMHPIRHVEEIAAKSLKQVNDTTWLYDLGRNIAGVSRLRVSGPRGTVIRLKHAERLTAGGRADLSNIDVYHRPADAADPFQTDIFILKGEGLEEFMPRFNYKGFQYVEVSSSQPISLGRESLAGFFMHSDVPAAGRMRSSNPLIDKIWQATNNSYLSNLFGYPTDCPQREKNGWTGDGHFAIETGLYNFDGITVYEKWLADHRDEQQPNGVLPDIIPTGGWGYGTANGADWTSTVAIIPWNIYLFYGDSRLLADSYPHIKRYVDYITRSSPTGLTSWGRGDWVPVKTESSLEFTSSVYYYTDALILAKAAKLLGRTADAQQYGALAARIRKAINDKYLDAAKASYAGGTQTELSMALKWGIVPEELKLRVAGTLARRVAADGMHLDVGVLGCTAILDALADNGQAETAYRLAAQDTYPSWGWWIVNGATTLYENWNIQAARDISMNHMMFGEVGGWLFKGIGGIRIDESRPGFKQVLLRPHFVSGLTHFEASHEGPYGTIRSAWKREGNAVIYTATVPPNSGAWVRLPLGRGQKAYLNGREVPAAVQVNAGTYRFEIR